MELEKLFQLFQIGKTIAEANEIIHDNLITLLEVLNQELAKKACMTLLKNEGTNDAPAQT